MTMNIFEYATLHKVRYPSPVGELTTEQLWDLPLLSKPIKGSTERPDLDKVAKAINNELKSITEESFVKTSSNPRVPLLTNALAVVKHIIEYKQALEVAAAERSAKAEKRAVLMQAYEAQQKEELVKGKSSEELLAALKALD